VSSDRPSERRYMIRMIAPSFLSLVIGFDE